MPKAGKRNNTAMTDNIINFEFRKRPNICTPTDVDIDAELNEITYHLFSITGNYASGNIDLQEGVDKICTLVDLSEADARTFLLEIERDNVTFMHK